MVLAEPVSICGIFGNSWSNLETAMLEKKNPVFLLYGSGLVQQMERFRRNVSNFVSN